jgi:hydrogenase maturation factor
MTAFEVPACHAEVCITCSDQGIPMRVERLDDLGLALCSGEDGTEAEVDLTLVAPVAAGDGVLVHAGVAIARLERAA